jgi:glycosidase
LPKVDFYGGDLEGINEKLNAGYFQELSVNTLWVSPVVLNPSTPYGQWLNPRTKFSGYHGYWPISLRTIDPRFGSSKSFESLIHDVHGKKMKILVDYVAHHVHESHALYKSNPEWFTSLYLADGSKNTERWDDYRLTTWFDDFMPTFNFFKPEVVNAMTDTALWWFKSYQIDGFRHDATKHIPNEFWRSLTFKLKKEMLSDSGRSVFQIGETYGSAELIGSYLGNGLLDAQFDFNVYDGAVNLFKSADGNGLEMAMILNESKRWYGSHHFMGNITGNQDRPRFISLADGSLKAGENYKQAGWDRDIQIIENSGYLKLQNLLSLMIVIPGVPVVYYGDEIGLPGAGDPDSRRMMVFDKEKLTEEQIFHFKQFQKLLKLRSENIALVYGDCQVESKTKNELIVKRSYFDEQVVFVHLNYTDTAEIQKISANYSEMELMFDNWVIDKTGKTVTRIYSTKR